MKLAFYPGCSSLWRMLSGHTDPAGAKYANLTASMNGG
jgi:hypothetical protein